MNKPQKLVLLIGTLVAIGMGLFPPWSYTYDFRSSIMSVRQSKPAGYGLIVSPPKPEKAELEYGVQLDSNRLIIQWIVVAIATGVGLVLLHGKENSSAKWWLLAAAVGLVLALCILAGTFGPAGAGAPGGPAAPAAPKPKWASWPVVSGGAVREVRANRFVVEDETGKARAVLDVDKNGPGLSLYDENGKVRAVLAVGKYRTGLHLYDENEKPRALLDVDKDGPGLYLKDDNGKRRALLDVGKEGPELHLLGPDEKSIWSAPR